MSKKRSKDEDGPSGKEEDAVYIGKRPTMNYVMATMMILNKGAECTVKARGRAISRAVDVAEITRNRFLQGMVVESITIGTEAVQGERGVTNVSTIEIVLGKGK